MEKSYEKAVSTLDLILEEKIGQISTGQDVPQELQEQVFATLDTLHFFAEVAELFTVKFTLAEMSILDAITHQHPREDGKDQLRKDRP